MRKYGLQQPYEYLKERTRGKKVTKELLHELIAGLSIPEFEKKRLLDLKPSNYLGTFKMKINFIIIHYSLVIDQNQLKNRKCN